MSFNVITAASLLGVSALTLTKFMRDHKLNLRDVNDIVDAFVVTRESGSKVNRFAGFFKSSRGKSRRRRQ